MFILYKLIDLCVIVFYITPVNKIINNLYGFLFMHWLIQRLMSQSTPSVIRRLLLDISDPVQRDCGCREKTRMGYTKHSPVIPCILKVKQVLSCHFNTPLRFSCKHDTFHHQYTEASRQSVLYVYAEMLLINWYQYIIAHILYYYP